MDTMVSRSKGQADGNNTSDITVEAVADRAHGRFDAGGPAGLGVALTAWSLWWTTTPAGCRRESAVRSAWVTSSLRWLADMDHPTTPRLNTSTTTGTGGAVHDRVDRSGREAEVAGYAAVGRRPPDPQASAERCARAASGRTIG
jgi:hypothetical protein